MNKRFLVGFFILSCVLLGIFIYSRLSKNLNQLNLPSIKTSIDGSNPLAIEYLRNQKYPGSEIIIEQTLADGSNYKRYLASYLSDGLKIYGLFTVPMTGKSANGFPSIVFLHGYLDPKTYITTEKYVAYQDAFAKNGYITFKPDLRGHGKSEGQAVNSNFSPDYVIDTLNLVSSLKIYKDANPNLIGMWGHSNGGGITLKALEISKDIKAGVIWAGVVGSYEDLLTTYRDQIPWIRDRHEPTGTPSVTAGSPQGLVEKYGQPNLNSLFWSKIDPYSYIQDISAPIQLQHGTADTSVPLALSQHLDSVLKNANKTVEFYTYQGDNHNLSNNLSLALKRSVDFFDKYLK